MKYFMKRYIIYLFALLLWSSVQFSLTSCTNDVYSDDSGIKLPEREVIEVTPVMGSWKIKTLDANVETGIPQVDEAIKEGIMSNPILVVFKNFDPVFTFGVEDVVITAINNDIPAGTYKYENNVLNYHMVVTGVGMGVPDIDQEVSLPITVSEDGYVITGTFDARPLVADQLQGMGIDPSAVTVDLVIALRNTEAPDEEEGGGAEQTPIVNTWDLKSMNADIETQNPELNTVIAQQIMENELLKKIQEFSPAFKFDKDGKVSLVVAGMSVSAGTYTYEESGKLHFDLELKGLGIVGIPDTLAALDFNTEMTDDNTKLTARLDIHFLLPDLGVDLSQAKTDLVVMLELAK